MDPYRHLNIPFSVSSAWCKTITDLNTVLNYNDPDCSLLTKDTRNFLKSLNLDLYNVANYWSWDKKSHNFYHIDGDEDYEKPCAALNYLLTGSPGITKWVDESKCMKLNTHQDPSRKTYSKMLICPYEPDYVTSIIPNYVMLTRVDVPHSVDRKDQTEIRWTYRFMLKRSNKFISWEDAVRLFYPWTHSS